MADDPDRRVSAPPAPVAARRASLRESRRRGRRTFWAAVASVSVLAGLWALATPITGGLEEPSAMIRAAGLVGDRTAGTEVEPGLHRVTLPLLYARAHEYSLCYRYQPAIPASCWVVDFTDVEEEADAFTTVGAANPLYSSVVGLPTLLPPSVSMLYLMRAVGAALCALLLGLGLRSLAEAPVRRWAVAGTAVAITPMVVFLASTVTPSGVEVAAALGLWLTLLVALRYPEPGLTTRRWLRAGVLVVFLANATRFGPVLLGVLTLVVLAVVPWPGVVAALRDRRSWPGLAVGLLGTAGAIVWIVQHRTWSAASGVPVPPLDDALEQTLRSTGAYVATMVGRFGWLDTPVPDTFVFWVIGFAVTLVVLAVAGAHGRARWAVAGLLVVVATVPVLYVMISGLRASGTWKGFEVLALAAGLPVLAGVLLDGSRGPVLGGSGRALVRLILAGTAFVHVAAFVVNLRRYTAGAFHPWFEEVPVPWVPPLPGPVLITAAAVTVVLSMVLLDRLGGRGPRPPAEPGRAPTLRAARGADGDV